MGRVTASVQIENVFDTYRVRQGDLMPEDIRRADVAEALVDTGATGLSLPKSMIQQLGLMPIRTRRAVTIDGIKEIATYGAVRLTLDGRDCVCDVSEISDDCPVLIGQVPLELMDFIVDPGRRKLIANPAHGGEHILELL